jgi:hypothetical protein
MRFSSIATVPNLSRRVSDAFSPPVNSRSVCTSPSLYKGGLSLLVEPLKLEVPPMIARATFVTWKTTSSVRFPHSDRNCLPL